MKVSARVCERCGRSKGVTFHRMVRDGKTVVVAAHVKCFILLRKKVKS